MTPGTYLRQSREAVDVSIELLAAKVATIPYATAEHERLAWIRRIEADDAPITADVAEAYRRIVWISDERLAGLILKHSGLAHSASAAPANQLELMREQQLPEAEVAA